MTQPFEFNKPVDEMTQEDIAAARRALDAERARLAGERAVTYAVDVLPDPAPTTGDEPGEPGLSDEDSIPVWPHQHMEYEGVMLEVRIPDESALMAVSMVSGGSLSGEVQMKIFTKFLQHHLSPVSFERVLSEMVDSDSKMNLVGIVTAMTQLRGQL